MFRTDEKEHNTFLVPTLCAPQCIIDKGVENGVAQYMVDKTLKVKDAHVESVKKAYEREHFKRKKINRVIQSGKIVVDNN